MNGSGGGGGGKLSLRISYHAFGFSGGHYAGLAVSADGAFHPTWVDNRTGVALLDRKGVVQQSSGTLPSGRELDLASPTCQACHRFPAPERRATATSDGDMSRALRR